MTAQNPESPPFFSMSTEDSSLDVPIPEPAGFSRRMAAMLYDGLLILALWMVTAGLVVVINGSEAVSGAWFQSLLFLEACAFFIFPWTRGQPTLGMQSWRLRLQTPSGDPITPWQAALRCVVGALSLAAFGLGYLWILIDPGKRSWTDIATGAMVVLAPPSSPRPRRPSS